MESIQDAFEQWDLACEVSQSMLPELEDEIIVNEIRLAGEH